MDYSSTQEVIVSTVSSFGASAIVILASIIGIAVGLLVFRFGWRKLNSSMIFDQGSFHKRNIKGARYDRYAHGYMSTAGESYDDFR